MTAGPICATLVDMRSSLSRVLPVLILPSLLGCPGDDGSGETTVAPTTTATGTSTTDAPGSTSDASSGEDSSTGPAGSSSSGVVDGSSSGGGEPACDPVVIGEWNACIGPDGSTDNLLCNYMGDPDGTGFLTCLSSATIEGGNICTIRDCVDVCDCFAPPATGTAPVVCAPILADGASACGLACDEGQACPDGMECGSGLCFWPPA